jgi:hypothetical protein
MGARFIKQTGHQLIMSKSLFCEIFLDDYNNDLLTAWHNDIKVAQLDDQEFNEWRSVKPGYEVFGDYTADQFVLTITHDGMEYHHFFPLLPYEINNNEWVQEARRRMKPFKQSAATDFDFWG